LIANDFDTFLQAGSHDKATVIQQNIDVTDGNGVSIELVRVKENPAINGIEIIPYTGPVPTAVPTQSPTAAPKAPVEIGETVARINAGGDEYLDTNGKLWSADMYAVNYHGQEYTSCPNEIDNTVDDALYCCHRWFSIWNGFPYVYSIPVGTNGVYEVRMHFAETVRVYCPLTL
jgi:hypothetical protein